VNKLSPFVNFEATFDWEFDTETKIFVKEVSMGFNNVSKTGLRTQIRQSMLGIYYFSHRNLQAKEAKVGPLIFFGSQKSSWLLQNGAPKEKLGLWATGKIYKAKILWGASLIQYRSLEFSAKLVNCLSFYLKFSGKVWNFPLSVIRLLKILPRYQENISNKLKSKNCIWGNYYRSHDNR
jgi:hypothetical protein